MPRAHLRVSLPRGTWVAAVSTAHPEVTIRVLAVFADGNGVSLARVSGPTDDVRRALAAIDDAAAVTALDVLADREDEALIRFETTTPLLARAAQAVAVPLEPPVSVRDGHADLAVTASSERLSALGDSLQAAGLPFDVLSVSPSVDEDGVLTERQHDLLERAAARGYYDTPREATLTTLAEEFGVAKSSLSETLHRAEGRLVAAYLDEVPFQHRSDRDRSGTG